MSSILVDAPFVLIILALYALTRWMLWLILWLGAPE